MQGTGCVIAQVKRFAVLTVDEVKLLKMLEEDPKHYSAGTTMCDADTQGACFYSLRSGWAYSTRILVGGQRQVLDIFLPGQIMGLRDIGFSRSLSDFVALTDLKACPFPRKRLTDACAKSPRMTGILLMILAREHAMLTERIINIGRRPATQRLAHFILEMKVRLQQSGDRFRLPLNQTIIGDALGLSAVHVSRTLKELRRMSLMSLRDGLVIINDLDALLRFAEFNHTYLEGPADWTSIGLPGIPKQDSALSL